MAIEFPGFKMFLATCTGNAQNTIYRNPLEIRSAEDMAAACRKDHVSTEFTDGKRGSDNFVRCFAIQGDCDNDDTEDPAAWITPDTIAARLPDVAFYSVKSRNCDKVKHPGEAGEKSARPRWHYYFPLRDPIEDITIVRDIMTRLLVVFPEFDRDGMKPAQFFFGHNNPESAFYPGEKDVSEFFKGHQDIDREQTQISADHSAMGKLYKAALASDKDDLLRNNLPDILKYFDPDDYDDWAFVGISLKSAESDYFRDWNDWSKASVKYPGEGNAWEKWDHDFKADGKTGPGSLFYEAKKRGWEQQYFTGCQTYDWDDVTDPATGEVLRKEVCTSEGSDQGLSVHQATGDSGKPVKPGESIPDFEEYNSDFFNNTEIIPPEPIIDRILYPGLGMLGAPAKMGKSYLVLQMACCVAAGTPFLGFEIKQPGSVLYLDLQGSKARTQQRLRAMGYQRMPDGISVVYKSRKTDTGLFTQIDRWLKKSKKPILIIVDMMEQVKGSQRKSEDSYRADNRILEPLHDLALRKGLSIMTIMHTRKGDTIIKDSDPFNEIIGSIAQFGTADCAWMIIGKRNNDIKRFSTICRDNVEGQQDYEVIFTNHRWSMAGTVEECVEKRATEEYNQSPVVFTIKALVKESGGSWKGTMSDLLIEVLKRKHDYPATTPEKMYHIVEELSFRLYTQDRISLESLNRNGGPKGRLYRFYREEPEQIEI